MHFLKKLTKIGEFLCSHFNIEDGRKYTSLAFYALLFQETTETQKKICVVYQEGTVTDWTGQKLFAKFFGTIDISAK